MPREPETILIVDDSPHSLSLLKLELEQHGYTVRAAKSGQEGLESISLERPDAVLLDFQMPEMSGLEVLKAIREHHSPSSLPVIIVTASSDTPTIVSTLVAGANDYVAKPVDFSILFARLEAQLARRRAEVEERHIRQHLEELVEQRTGELKDKERLLSAIIDNLPLPIFVKDAEARHILVNPALAKLHGMEAGEIIGLTSAEIPTLRRDVGEDLLEQDMQVLKNEAGIEIPDQKISDGSGHARTHHIRKVPLRGDGGEVNGLLGISMDITERVMAGEEIRKKEEQFRNLFEGSIQGVLVHRDYQMLFANQAFASMLGYGSPEELLREIPLAKDFLPPEDMEYMGRINQHRNEGLDVPDVHEARFLHRNGSPIHVELFVRMIEWEGENANQTTCIDITERKKAEAALVNSEKRLSGILDMAVEGIISVDQDSKIVLFNQGAERIFGYRSEELIGQSLGMLIPEKFREAHIQHIREFESDSGESIPMTDRGEIQGLRKNGEIFPAEASISKFRLNEQWVDTVFLRDISTHRKTERSLRENRRLLQTVFDTVPHWLFVKDVNARFLMVNSHYAESLQMKAEEFIGKTYGEVDRQSNPREIAISDEMDQKVIASHTPQEVIANVLDFEGNLRRRHVTKLPLEDEQGRVMGVVGTSEDITEREQTEAVLRQAQKMEAVGQLTGGVAHDFNNILQIISGYSQMARKAPELSEKTADNLDKVLQAAGRASGLTQQLLAFSRQSVLQATTLDLNNLIENLEKMVRLLIGVDNDLVIDAGEILPVSADAGMIEQVLFNLCINARDAMPEGGRITIATRSFHADSGFTLQHAWEREGTYVELEISDTGEGMTREVQDRIFEPFYTTKETGKGTGLGLAMVYGIVQQHKGHLTVSSEPGAGTTFKLFLPVSGEGEVIPDKEVISETAGGTETILVAEDTREVLEFVVDMLEAYGYRVLSAKDGIQALELFNREMSSIDLVMLDVVMPKMGGREVYERIKQIKPLQPVMLTTGFGANSIDSDFLSRENLTLIQKPYLPEGLFRTVREVLDQSPRLPAT